MLLIIHRGVRGCIQRQYFLHKMQSRKQKISSAVQKIKSNLNNEVSAGRSGVRSQRGPVNPEQPSPRPAWWLVLNSALKTWWLQVAELRVNHHICWAAWIIYYFTSLKTEKDKAKLLLLLPLLLLLLLLHPGRIDVTLHGCAKGSMSVWNCCSAQKASRDSGCIRLPARRIHAHTKRKPSAEGFRTAPRALTTPVTS